MSPAQLSAVMHGEGPALVLAGPGSGKTTVITKRAVRLSGKMRSPGRLLCVTFTTAAAEEMRTRYLRLIKEERPAEDEAGDNETETPVFSTVHAYCNSVLTEYERRTGKRFIRIEGEDSPKNAILSGIYKKYNGQEPDDAMLQRIKGYMRFEREHGKTRQPSGRNQIRRFDDIVKEYARQKEAYGYVDFDDMIRLCGRIMREDRDISKLVRSRFDYIQVDEAQDLSRIQFDVIRLISPGDNIFVVADDDQSIYGFRGAEPDCLFEFLKEHPDAARYELTRNFRSTPEIVAASAALISRNGKRFEKHLFTASVSRPDSFEIRYFTDAAAQAEFFRETALKAMEAGKTVAALYRNGISSLPGRFALSSEGIRFATFGNCPGTWNVPTVSRCLEAVRKAEREAGLVIPAPAQTFRKLLRSGFAEEEEEKIRRTGRDRKTVSVALDFLKLLTAKAESYAEMLKLLDRMDGAGISFLNGPEPSAPLPPGTPVFSTIHSSKGLEYDVVTVLDVLEGELPGSEAAGAAVEEERRLLYVAMTRARKRLVLCCPYKRGIRGEEESRFLRETAAGVEGEPGSGERETAIDKTEPEKV